MATFCSATDTAGKSVVRCFVKGAAPAVFDRTTTALANGETMPLDDALRKKGDNAVVRMAGEGHRVMAAAVRDLDPAAFDPEGDLLGYVTDLQLTSIVGMVDPPREESKAAVRDAQRAHIRVRMVTGDDVTTGAAIAKQLGIPGEAMLGTEFAAMSEPERLRRIDDIGVVGRVAPEHKVLLVETLRKKGQVVAMTGDGVNDAPAIKAADIGIAMGSGTEVAKNAGRMILSDDNFATIVKAVEKGRAVYDNLNKYIRFVMLELVAYIITFLGASILNIAAGQPFSASQILYINFLVNAPLGIALGMDKETPGLMARSPRPRDATIMTRGLLTTAGLVGLFMAVVHACADQLRQVALRQRGDRLLHGAHGVLAAHRGLGLPGQERDRDGAHQRDVRQPAPELDGAGGDRPRRPHHADGRHAPHLRDRAADRQAMAARTGAGHRAVLPLGARQADRAARDRAGDGGGGSARRGDGRLSRWRGSPGPDARPPGPRVARWRHAVTPPVASWLAPWAASCTRRDITSTPRAPRGQAGAGSPSGSEPDPAGAGSEPGCFLGIRPVKKSAMTPMTAKIESAVRRPAI